MTKFLMTADVHANRTRAADVVKLFNNITDKVIKEKINYVLIGGDLWDSPINNTKASGFVDIVSAIKKLQEVCQVVFIYGTISHESSGSLSVFSALGCTVIESAEVLDLDGMKLLCIPEPRRSNFVRDTVQETTDAMNEYLTESCKNKADVILFHGEISGAMLQNGVKAKSDVQLTKQMIDNTGAQLTLAGHIHLPSNVYKNVYYVGSPIPCNFGETHSPSIITFSFDGKVKNFKREETKFPVKKQYDLDRETYEKLYKLKYPNTDIKLKISLTAEEKLLFNIRKEEQCFLKTTEAHSVKMSIYTKKEVSVRSREIAKVTTPEEKLKIYGEVNNVEITETIIDKMKKIEDNLMIKYLFPTHSFELLSIDVKGAKGLKDYEEYKLDFTKYADGILGLVALNGRGKSTLLELCSPYPRMLTRSGTLRSHFYLKDSHRILVFRDENGMLYKLTIQMAAHTDNGLCKYFAETSDDYGMTWNSVPGVDGNLDSYSEWVDGTFGSLPLYLRTAFYTQGKVKGINDIATATKAERITLLSSLLGFDNLSAIHDLIKEELKRINSEMEKYSNPESELSEIETQLNRKKVNEKSYQNDLLEIAEKLATVESNLKYNRRLKSDFDKNFANYSNAVELKEGLENRVFELQTHLDSLKNHKKKNDYYINHQKEIAEYEETLKQFEILKKDSDKRSEKLRNAQEELLLATDAFNKAERQFDIEERKLENTDNRIKSAEDSVCPIGDNCPTCGAKLSERKKANLIKAYSYQVNEVEALKQFKINQTEIVSTAKKALSAAKTELKKATEAKNKYQTAFNEANEKLNATEVWLDMNDLSEYIGYAVVTNLEEDIERTSELLKSAKQQFETLKDVELIDYQSIIDNLEAERTKYEEFRLRLSVDLGSIQTEIKALEEKKEEVENYVNIVRQLSKEHEDYVVLEKAFSNGGIPALELEANAPEIALLTNQILQECYGDKFSVSFSTLKQGRDKLIDDFSIDVTNTETGWTTPIEMLSQGERVWIIQSIYYALSLIRQQKTGFSFNVRFVDESDGALDTEMRLKYVSMLNSVHKYGSARLTVLVTHSQEVKDLLTQIIKL